ncbi:nucleotidyltransferase family protein [Negadavirga shengliensis]|uniref:Nucleotidyltransferase family protein n=1 Tax=Negadavirga shengliensis TaxID=1389218 RepID=A0ABV9T7U2_9BACT
MDHLDFYRDIILKLKPELEKRYLVNSIGLFGSVVRPDFSENTSDIDILVDFKEPVGIEFIELGDYLEKILNKKVDLVSKKGIKPKYLRAIESEIIYV